MRNSENHQLTSGAVVREETEKLPNAATMEERLQRFNPATMSGVFPGTRTITFERVRLAAHGKPGALTRWARISWYEDPPACTIEMESARMTSTLVPLEEQGESPEHLSARLEASTRTDASLRLAGNLQAAGWQLQTCGTCTFWHPLTSLTPDGLGSGRCTWSSKNEAEFTVPAMLATQSSLGLRCVHWEQRGDAGDQSDLEPEVAATLAPIRRRAEQESDQRWSLWGRIRRTFSKQERRTGASSGSSSRVEEILIERSGVGAGTEPCLVCQGRIANLAALTVATPEGDKQTYSVWRCRSCYTCYLNDWIDRWERSESLETEERYYRVAPQEALQLLRMIDGVVNAEHPARRHERTAERQYMIQFIGDRRPLSHEIKQGR